MVKEMNLTDKISLVVIYVMIVLAFLFGEPYGVRQSYVITIAIIVTMSIIWYLTKK